jgi:hypothetical protein
MRGGVVVDWLACSFVSLSRGFHMLEYLGDIVVSRPL